VVKLIDYTTVPLSRCYVLLEQTAVAATLFQRETGGFGSHLVIPGENWSCLASMLSCLWPMSIRA
jgi:hypothetical protein